MKFYISTVTDGVVILTVRNDYGMTVVRGQATHYRKSAESVREKRVASIEQMLLAADAATGYLKTGSGFDYAGWYNGKVFNCDMTMTPWGNAQSDSIDSFKWPSDEHDNDVVYWTPNVSPSTQFRWVTETDIGINLLP